MGLELEFDDVKKLRKSLLVASVVGIFLAKLVKYSKEDTTIDFLGFSLPIGEATFLPNYIGYLIIFFMVALLIRYNNDEFQKFYDKVLKNIDKSNPDNFVLDETNIDKINKRLEFAVKTKSRSKFTKFSVFTLDIIFPIVLGVVALIIIFFKL